jgi:hypothetical protein
LGQALSSLRSQRPTTGTFSLLSLVITRHGATRDYYIPAKKRSRKAELEAMRAAAKELDEMIASWGASEDELMEEIKEIRRTSREKKRNAG